MESLSTKAPTGAGPDAGEVGSGVPSKVTGAESLGETRTVVLGCTDSRVDSRVDSGAVEGDVEAVIPAGGVADVELAASGGAWAVAVEHPAMSATAAAIGHRRAREGSIHPYCVTGVSCPNSTLRYSTLEYASA
ncbi:MAG: hypothetical protein K9G80_01925 [Candidatus Nanopelagicales bacterium]|nr:hypothetical protein [Candidatus Nanopelagicales bacterium]